MPPCWPKMELKKYSTTVNKSSLVDRFWCLRCINDRIDLPDMKGYLQVAPLTPWWPKLDLKILNIFIIL